MNEKILEIRRMVTELSLTSRKLGRPEQLVEWTDVVTRLQAKIFKALDDLQPQDSKKLDLLLKYQLSTVRLERMYREVQGLSGTTRSIVDKAVECMEDEVFGLEFQIQQLLEGEA